MKGAEPFATQVARRRKALNLTQEALADLADVSRGTVRNIEAGSVIPNSTTVSAIQAALAGAERGGPIALAGDGSGSRVWPVAPQEQAGPGAPPMEADIRESIASQLDMLADAFPAYPDDSSSLASILARTARHAYQHAARIVRGGA